MNNGKYLLMSNGSFASQIRGICSGGRYQPNNLSVNTMEFVEISSTSRTDPYILISYLFLSFRRCNDLIN